MSLSASGTTAATAKSAPTAVKRVLLVDDDETLRHTLAEQLEMEGDFATIEAGTGASGLEMAKQEKLDAILLDVGLPDVDGRQLCAQMRDAGVSVPIIMLTAVDGDADTIEGLESGANDYVTKPFRLGVLLARLRAHLRQHEHSEDAVLQIGPYVFRPNIKMLVDEVANKKIRLT